MYHFSDNLNFLGITLPSLSVYLFAHTAIPKRNWYSYFGVLPIYGLEHIDEINDEIVLMLWDIKVDTHPFSFVGVREDLQ